MPELNATQATKVAGRRRPQRPKKQKSPDQQVSAQDMSDLIFSLVSALTASATRLLSIHCAKLVVAHQYSVGERLAALCDNPSDPSSKPTELKTLLLAGLEACTRVTPKETNDDGTLKPDPEPEQSLVLRCGEAVADTCRVLGWHQTDRPQRSVVEKMLASEQFLDNVAAAVAKHCRNAYLDECALAIEQHLQGGSVSKEAVRLKPFDNLSASTARDVARLFRRKWAAADKDVKIKWADVDMDQALLRQQLEGEIDEDLRAGLEKQLENCRNMQYDLVFFERALFEPFLPHQMSEAFVAKTFAHIAPVWYHLHMRNRGKHVLDDGPEDIWEALHGWELCPEKEMPNGEILVKELLEQAKQQETHKTQDSA